MAENGNGECKARRANVVLLDIEGTTTSITFVKEKLFPYASAQVQEYLNTHWEEEECKKDVDLIREQLITDKKEGKDNVPQVPPSGNHASKSEVLSAVVEGVKWLMAADRKVSALKELQGHIWRHGYENGDLQGHIYPDVPSVLKTWHEDGIRVCIYSSGSVQAQKLLFHYSENGNLLPYISDHFDTHVGSKRESSSYQRIATELNVDQQDVVFLTDIPAEAAAAKKAGMQVIVVTRPKNAPLSDEEREEYNTISSLTGLTVTPVQHSGPTPKQPKINHDSV